MPSGGEAAFAEHVDARSGNIMCGYCASVLGEYAAVEFLVHEKASEDVHASLLECCE